MSASRAIVLCVLVAGLAAGVFWWRWQNSSPQAGQSSAVTIEKQPVAFSKRAFDPSMPPPEMPPLAQGEEAECDSNFLSSASVNGEAQRVDATHALVTVRHIDVNLQLTITIWAPANATSHVLEHEDGHRQISEHYYESAGETARRIAEKYVGERVEVSGADLEAETSRRFQQVADEIRDEYNMELNPESAQLLYDGITNHGRNEVIVRDAVSSAIKNAAAGPPAAVSVPGN